MAMREDVSTTEDAASTAGLQAELASTAERANRAEVQLRSANANISRMTEQLEVLQRELTEARCGLAKCQEEAAATSTLASTLGARAGDLDQQVALLRGWTEELELQVAGVAAERDRLQAELVSTHQSADDATAARNLLATQLEEAVRMQARSAAAAAAAEDQYRGDMQQLQVRLAALEAECRALQHAKGTQHDELQRVRADALALQGQLQEETRHREELVSENRRLQRDLEAALESLANAQRAQRTTAAGALDREAELNLLRAARSTLEAELQAAEARMQRLQEEGRQLTERNTELATQVHGLSATVHHLETENARLADGHATLRVEVAVRAAEVRAARGEAVELAADRARLMAELQALKAEAGPDEADRLRKALLEARADVARLQKEVAANDAVLAEAETALVALVREKEELGQQLGAARAAEHLAAEAEKELRAALAALQAGLGAAWREAPPAVTPSPAPAEGAAAPLQAANDRMDTYLQSLVAGGTGLTAHQSEESIGDTGQPLVPNMPPMVVAAASSSLPGLQGEGLPSDTAGVAALSPALAHAHSNDRYPVSSRLTSDSGSAHSAYPQASGTNPDAWEAASTSAWDNSAGGSMIGAAAAVLGVQLFSVGLLRKDTPSTDLPPGLIAAPGVQGPAPVLGAQPPSAQGSPATPLRVLDPSPLAAPCTTTGAANVVGQPRADSYDGEGRPAAPSLMESSGSMASAVDAGVASVASNKGAADLNAASVPASPFVEGTAAAAVAVSAEPEEPAGRRAPEGSASLVKPLLLLSTGGPAAPECCVGSSFEQRLLDAAGNVLLGAPRSSSHHDSDVGTLGAAASRESAVQEPANRNAAPFEAHQTLSRPQADLPQPVSPHHQLPGSPAIQEPAPLAAENYLGLLPTAKALIGPAEAGSRMTRAVGSVRGLDNQATVYSLPSPASAGLAGGGGSVEAQSLTQRIAAGIGRRATHDPAVSKPTSSGLAAADGSGSGSGGQQRPGAGGSGSSPMISPRMLFEAKMLSRAVRSSTEALSTPLRTCQTVLGGHRVEAVLAGGAGAPVPAQQQPEGGRGEGKPLTGSKTLPILQALASQQLLRQQQLQLQQHHLQQLQHLPSQQATSATPSSRSSATVDIAAPDPGAFATAAASGIAAAAVSSANLPVAAASQPAGVSPSPSSSSSAAAAAAEVGASLAQLARRVSSEQASYPAAGLAPSGSVGSIGGSRPSTSASSLTHQVFATPVSANRRESVQELEAAMQPGYQQLQPLGPAGEEVFFTPKAQLTPTAPAATGLILGSPLLSRPFETEDIVLAQRLAAMDEALRAIGAM